MLFDFICITHLSIFIVHSDGSPHKRTVFSCFCLLSWVNGVGIEKWCSKWGWVCLPLLIFWPSFADIPLWRHQMKTFSALLALCAGKTSVTDEFPAQRPVTRNLDISFDLRLNKHLSKQSWGWWFETPSRSLWRLCNVPIWAQLLFREAWRLKKRVIFIVVYDNIS